MLNGYELVRKRRDWNRTDMHSGSLLVLNLGDAMAAKRDGKRRYMLVYNGACGQELCSGDYPKSWDTKAAAARYLAEVSSETRPIYWIGEFRYVGPIRRAVRKRRKG